MHKPPDGVESSDLEFWEQSFWVLKLHQGSKAKPARQIAKR